MLENSDVSSIGLYTFCWLLFIFCVRCLSEIIPAECRTVKRRVSETSQKDNVIMPSRQNSPFVYKPVRRCVSKTLNSLSHEVSGNVLFDGTFPDHLLPVPYIGGSQTPPKPDRRTDNLSWQYRAPGFAPSAPVIFNWRLPNVLTKLQSKIAGKQRHIKALIYYQYHHFQSTHIQE